MTEIIIHHYLDTRGLRCPEPIMMLHKMMRKAQPLEVIEVLGTDPSTSWDIPKFCLHLGHELILQEQYTHDQQVEYRYLIQKKDSHL